MKTQVLIPAQNESARIGRILHALPASDFDVTVIVNGSTDNTFEVSSRFATTYDIDEAGKLPALQHGLKQLGTSALDLILIIDADTVPVNTDLWCKHMSIALRPEINYPSVASGPVIYTPNDTGTLSPLFRSVFRYGETVKTKHEATTNPQVGAQFGPNMGIHLARASTLDAVLDLPHIWPKEDVALAMTVVDSHPEGRFDQVIHPFATTFTPRPKPMQPLLDWILKPEATMHKERQAYELSRPAANTMSFEDWSSGR